MNRHRPPSYDTRLMDAIESLRLTFTYLSAFGIASHCYFDLGLCGECDDHVIILCYVMVRHECDFV